MSDKQENLRFAVLATDTVIFTLQEETLKVLLMEVKVPPYYTDILGFPGGLIDPEETAEESAKRIIKDKSGLPPERISYFEQLYTFSQVDRDPRNRVVSVAYLGLIAYTNIVKKQDNIVWKPVPEVGELAYDHNKMLETALERLRAKLEYTNIIYGLMPKRFTLSELQSAYELILEKDFDKRNFRKKIDEAGLVESTGEKQQDVPHRPAELYRFVQREPKVIEIF